MIKRTWISQRVFGRIKVFLETYLFANTVQLRFRTYSGHVQLISRQMHLETESKVQPSVNRVPRNRLMRSARGLGELYYLQAERLFERFRYAFDDRLMSAAFTRAFRNDVHRPRIQGTCKTQYKRGHRIRLNGVKGRGVRASLLRKRVCVAFARHEKGAVHTRHIMRRFGLGLFYLPLDRDGRVYAHNQPTWFPQIFEQFEVF